LGRIFVFPKIGSNAGEFKSDSQNMLKPEAFPKLQLLGMLLTPGENCISHKCLFSKELAIFSKSLSQN
jgi:hypothetical protein